jgi:hypothetical protein
MPGFQLLKVRNGSSRERLSISAIQRFSQAIKRPGGGGGDGDIFSGNLPLQC